MSDVLLDFMEADTQSGASNVEKVSDGGLQSVADLARAVQRQRGVNRRTRRASLKNRNVNC